MIYKMCKTVGRGVGWGPSAGAERPVRGKILFGLFFFMDCHMSLSAHSLRGGTDRSFAATTIP